MGELRRSTPDTLVVKRNILVLDLMGAQQDRQECIKVGKVTSSASKENLLSSSTHHVVEPSCRTIPRTIRISSITKMNLTALVILLSVAGATRDIPSPAQEVPSSAQNECMGDSMGRNCIDIGRMESGYSYDPGMHSDDKNSSNGLEIHRIESSGCANDRLSERDHQAFNSKGPSFWNATDQETLRQVLFVHRHGDRTPIDFSSGDNLRNESCWQFHGPGQLTNRGKARLNMLGKIIRLRYNTFLGGSVSKNWRKSRSSGSLRCIESAQMFLSTFLSLTDRDCPDAESLIWDRSGDELAQLWQPASILTLAAKYDGMLNEGAQCRSIESEYASFDDSEENRRLLEEFKHEADVIKAEIGFEMDHFYKWFWAASVLEVERTYLEHKMKPALLTIYDRIQEAGDRSLMLLQSSLKSRRLRAGLLIDDMIGNMEEVRNESQSKFTKKFVHYAGHDITIIYLLGLLDNTNRFSYRPDYASNLMFELHQDQNEWFIKVFYMPHVPSGPIEVHFDACEKGHEKNRCTLERFEDLMSKYRITSWMNWMQECDNPLTSVNPYQQNS